MRVLVTGGRHYGDRARVFNELDRLHGVDRVPGGKITLVIHGACVLRGSKELRGADRWAQEWAIEREVPYLGHPAPWKLYGNGAGPRRNESMITRWRPVDDVMVVLAFPGGSGTADMVNRARQLKITLITVTPRDDVSLSGGGR